MLTYPLPQRIAADAVSLVAMTGDKFTAPGETEWLNLSLGLVAAQVSGTSTSFTAILERAFVDPATVGADIVWAPADDTNFTGDLTAGVPTRLYQEVGFGWWRIRVSAVGNGYVYAAIQGLLTCSLTSSPNRP